MTELLIFTVPQGSLAQVVQEAVSDQQTVNDSSIDGADYKGIIQ